VALKVGCELACFLPLTNGNEQNRQNWCFFIHSVPQGAEIRGEIRPHFVWRKILQSQGKQSAQ